MNYLSIAIPTIIDIPRNTRNRQRVTQFGDGYLQTAPEAFNAKTETYQVTTRTLEPCTMEALIKKLEETQGHPFYWKNPAFEKKKLVRIFPFDWELRQIGPLKQQLTFTLRTENTP